MPQITKYDKFLQKIVGRLLHLLYDITCDKNHKCGKAGIPNERYANRV